MTKYRLGDKNQNQQGGYMGFGMMPYPTNFPSVETKFGVGPMAGPMMSVTDTGITGRIPLMGNNMNGLNITVPPPITDPISTFYGKPTVTKNPLSNDSQVDLKLTDAQPEQFMIQTQPVQGGIIGQKIPLNSGNRKPELVLSSPDSDNQMVITGDMTDITKIKTKISEIQEATKAQKSVRDAGSKFNDATKDAPLNYDMYKNMTLEELNKAVADGTIKGVHRDAIIALQAAKKKLLDAKTKAGMSANDNDLIDGEFVPLTELFDSTKLKEHMTKFGVDPAKIDIKQKQHSPSFLEQLMGPLYPSWLMNTSAYGPVISFN